MTANSPALTRFFSEAKKVIGADLLNGGIFADKPGYHNTRANHLRKRPGDYSIQHFLDKQGPSNYASAIDLTFVSAQASRFANIAKYSRNLYNGMVRRDSRLFKNGEWVIREFFGNTDDDRTVEGYSSYRRDTKKPGPATSDSSHLWHIHISFYRKFSNDWLAVKGVLDVMLGRPIEEEDVPLDANDKRWIQGELAKLPNNIWEHKLPVSSAAELAGWPEDFTAPARGYLVGKDAAQTAILRNQAAMMKAINAVAVKVDALDEQLGQELRNAIEGAQFVADIDVIQEQ